MNTCTTQGQWVITESRTGEVTACHLRREARWTIETDEAGETRLTVFPDATTYGWLLFRNEEEARRFVDRALRKRRRKGAESAIARQIAEWLTGTASSS
jgi:hypothetical protein